MLCKMVKDSQGVWVCGIDGDDFCIGYHCDDCGTSLCSYDCPDRDCDRQPTEPFKDGKDDYQCVYCYYRRGEV